MQEEGRSKTGERKQVADGARHASPVIADDVIAIPPSELTFINGAALVKF